MLTISYIGTEFASLFIVIHSKAVATAKNHDYRTKNNIMKTSFSYILFFSLVLFSSHLLAQTTLSFALDKAQGSLIILDASQKDVTTAYKINFAEFDIYQQAQYVGSIQLENGKISTDELRPKESLQVAKMQLTEVSTGKVINIQATKPATMVNIK